MLFWLAQLATLVLSVSAAVPTATKRADTSPFVTVKDGQFYVNGSIFKFVGTTAYWLSALENEQDIDNTLASIKAAKFSVVRTWAFNDVTEIPQNGTWFQHIQSDGSTTINEGANGLQKLDKVIELAQKHGLYVLLSLTNNWYPNANLGEATPTINNAQSSSSKPRNALSNDYGGMDAYIRAFGGPQLHDQFYHNETIVAAFNKYSDTIVSRYATHPGVFGWELANDARCNSTLPSSNNCQTTLVTQWHADTAKTVKKADPNHIVSSGTSGYFCADCKKLFPRTTPTPAPAPSPAPGSQKSRRDKLGFLSRATLLKERKALWKRERERRKASNEVSEGVRIRGRWVSTAAKRQADLDVGSAYDGAHGVDSEDIINIPDIGFGSFQLFPDQYNYGTVDPTLPKFNQTVQVGLEWIQKHADAGKLYGKPVSLTGFGLVTQDNAPAFTPFNSSVAPYGSDASNTPNTAPYGLTEQERNDAYSQWIQAGVAGGLQGIIQYQWSQSNLTTGSTISDLPNESGVSDNPNTSGVSPNDGYATLGQGQQQLVDTIQEASAGFASDTA